MSDMTTIAGQVPSRSKAVRPVILFADEADEVAVAAASTLHVPDHADHPDTDLDALSRGVVKIDASASPFDDPIYLATLKAGGWSVLRVDGLTAWITLGNGEATRVEATVGVDLTVYDALQDRDAPRTRPWGGWRSGGRFYRFHSPAAAARFADTLPPLGARRHVGDGWALESYGAFAHEIADMTVPALGQPESPRALAA